MRTLVLLLALLPGLALAEEPAKSPAPAPATTPPPPAPPAKKAPANQVYKWVDDKGVVHYTDKPPAEGAQPAKLPPLQTYKEGTAPPNLGKFAKSVGPATGAPGGGPQVEIVTPSREETFRGGERVVPIAVMVTPQLREGQKLIYLLDGTPASPAVAQTSYALTEVDRGAHTVSVTLIDSSGQELANSATVTFYMHPPTVDQGKRNQGQPTTPGQAKPPKPKPPSP